MFYQDLDTGERVCVSGWGLYHKDTREPVRSGEFVQSTLSIKDPSISITSGRPPQAPRDRGVVWCPRWHKEFKPQRYGLKWVKLGSEGEPLF